MSRNIRVVSWNVQYSSDLEDIENTLDKILNSKKPDVILLQELTSDAVLGYRPDMPEYLADKFSLNYVTSSHDNKTLRFTESVGIYSPHKFKKTDGDSINERRGVQSAAIDFSGTIYSFIAVHLTTPMVNPKAYSEECDELVEFVQGLDKRTVLGGDLNSKRDTDVVKRLSKILNIPDENPETWHTRMPISMQMDYIMTTNDLDVDEFIALDIGDSDHRPVYASIK